MNMPNELGAVLIVRNEERYLEECLRSLTAVVDEIVVYDTGSTDQSVEIARHYADSVASGPWNDSFADARNRALESSTSTWVLSIDADERVMHCHGRLRNFLSTTAGEVALVDVQCEAPRELGGSYRTRLPRIFRRESVQWQGGVHERLAHVDGSDPSIVAIDREWLALIDVGYDSLATVRRKATRNLAILHQEIATLRDDDDVRLATLSFELGRCLITLEHFAEAMGAFALSAERSHICRLQSYDHLAKLALANRDFEGARRWIEQLRSNGARSNYLAWLLAQVDAQTGNVRRAIDGLAQVDRVIDTAGRDFGNGPVLEMQILVSLLAGEVTVAQECFARLLQDPGASEAIESVRQIMELSATP
jgi:glycosyltransferase involved in cell wall biosynthesis